MNNKFKIIEKRALLCLVIASLFMCSCLNDDTQNINFNNNELETIRFNSEKFNSIKNNKEVKNKEDHIYYSKTTKLFSPATGLDKSNNDLIVLLIYFAQVNEENLNSLVSSFPNDVDIVSITLAKDENSIANGIIIHYILDDGKMEVAIFEKEISSDNYNLIDFSAKEVDSYTLDDILFISKRFFPEHDIEALGVDDIDSRYTSSKYNDISLLSFAHNYGYRNDDDVPQLYPSGSSSDPGDDVIGSTRPCGLTHHCQNGNNIRTNCQPFAQGCQQQPDCPRWSSRNSMITMGMITESNTLDANLSFDNLYSVRDWLTTKTKGNFYVEAYYAISKHFQESIDVEILYKIVNSSNEVGVFVDAFLNNQNEVILTEGLYDSIIEIAQTSAENSKSNLYKDIIAKLIATTDEFKGKTIGEIKYLLK